MSNNDNLPVRKVDTSRRPGWIGDVETYVFEVSRHDQNDITVARQYLVLFLEDADDGRYVLSNVSAPVTTEKEF